MYLQQENLVVTTAADGTATATTSSDFWGFLQAINYVVDGSVPYTNSVVILVTGAVSGVVLWSVTLNPNASALLYPRTATHSTAGAALLFAAGGTAVTDKIPLAGEKIKVVLSAGGNAKSGAFRFIAGG
jgi:hypothetical protein